MSHTTHDTIFLFNTSISDVHQWISFIEGHEHEQEHEQEHEHEHEHENEHDASYCRNKRIDTDKIK